MRRIAFGLTAAIGLLAIPSLAAADDPRDPAMQTSDARARDRAMIRQLNREQLAYVRKRDAAYAEGWRAYDRAKGNSRTGQENYQRDMDRYDRDQARYHAQRKEYERAMADWQRDIAACRAGQVSACN